MSAQTIRLLLVHDTLLVCHMLAATLERYEFEIVACSATVKDAIQRLKNEDFDIILVSRRLPENGAVHLTNFVKRNPILGTKVIVYEVTENVHDILHFSEAGAVGYIFSDGTVKDLVDTIRNVYAGKIKISPELALALMKRISKMSKLLSGIRRVNVGKADLTSREFEILTLIQNNLTNEEIANELVIEIGTVKNHVHNILKKLNVSSRKEASYYLLVNNTIFDPNLPEGSADTIYEPEYIR